MAWYRKAADQGHSFGQNNLGRMLLWGRDIPKEPALAHELFRRSAAQGNSSAAYNLGQVYEKGQGVTANAQEAARWYREALRNGIESVERAEVIEHAKAFVAANP